MLKASVISSVGVMVVVGVVVAPFSSSYSARVVMLKADDGFAMNMRVRNIAESVMYAALRGIIFLVRGVFCMVVLLVAGVYIFLMMGARRRRVFGGLKLEWSILIMLLWSISLYR